MMSTERVSRAARAARRVVTVAALCICVATALADDAATRGMIPFKAGLVVTQPQGPDALASALSAAARGDAQHVVVQLDGPLTATTRKQLAAAGITVQRYLGDNAFFAHVDRARADAAALADVTHLRCILAVQPSWKTHPDFLDGVVPRWAIVSGAKATPSEEGVRIGALAAREPQPGQEVMVAAYVLFHDDVPAETEGVRILHRHGALVRSVVKSINGAVVELPGQNVPAVAAEDAVLWIEPPLPRFGPCNDSNRTRTGAGVAQDPPYGLTGEGVTVMVYDGGTADADHPDFGGRVFARDDSGEDYHATHVAGTIGGDGYSSGGLYRGMAPAVTIQSYGFEYGGGQGFLYTDPGDIEEDYSEAILSYAADIANNSIGTNTALNGFPCEWEGNYGVTANLIDTIVRGDGSNPLFTTPFRIVWANGNERQTSRCGSTYLTTAPPACAKNHITVGALNSNDDTMTNMSSWGPTDDGRIKPDLCAPGCQTDDDGGVTSCDVGGGYRTLCGTSMAAPTVCGLGALVIQDYRQQFPAAPDLRNATLKALLTHTAADEVAPGDHPGPDYMYGYGSVRIIPAIDVLRAGNFFEQTIDQDGVYSVVVVAQPGDDELRVTLAWDDVPGTPDVTPVLVNDLDLHVYDAANTRYFPWTLDPGDPSAPAVRTQADHVNNIEQVVIDNPAPGAYRVEVHGFNVPMGPQPFALVASPYLVDCSSQGTLELDRPKYACNAAAVLRVVDCDLDLDDTVIDEVVVTIASDSEPAGEPVLLSETDVASATFLGTIALETTDADGVLWITAGDTITATYVDEDDGLGGTNVTVTDTAVVDCAAPLVMNVVVSAVNPRDATVTFQTDEPAQVVLRYGTACGALPNESAGAGFGLDHMLTLTDLDDGTTYFFEVVATDEAGNTDVDNNGGACYHFTTPEVQNFFTEAFFDEDNDLDDVTLLFVPLGGIDTYVGCAYPISELPTDPSGGTPLTLSDDGSVLVTLSDEATVTLYGVEYGGVYVGSNGYLTFTGADTDHSETLIDHFDQPRIAALFDDLNPSSAGTVSWQQLDDRFVVTWEGVPEYLITGANTFQIEMFFDGSIAISYLSVTAADGIIGLSAGDGLPADFFETDLSAMTSCPDPRPPHAFGGDVLTDHNTPVTIALEANDDGLPNPPGALTYIIDTLPEHGTLSDPNGAVISADDLPYALVDGGNAVVYMPTIWFGGADGFTFHANDGGIPPEGGDSNTATVAITVGGPQVVYSFPMDADPNWATEGAWGFGQPTGAGSHNGDPSSGYTGINVYGYNLFGDYFNNMERYYLTTDALDLTGIVDTSLRFWRWLGVESSTWDHAGIEVSSDGTNWSSVWEHAGATVSDSAWLRREYDISAVADDEPTVYIRWAMGTTDSVTTYPGWNIDDVEIWGVAPQSPVGDMNCDGVASAADIDGFVVALTQGADGYAALYPDCEYTYADVNGDGSVSAADIDGFVTLLTR
jgi:hypothetical protein